MNLVQIAVACAETIREAGSVPSGVLYAGLMAHGVTMTQYEAIVATLLRTGLVEQASHVLTWVGPVYK